MLKKPKGNQVLRIIKRNFQNHSMTKQPDDTVAFRIQAESALIMVIAIVVFSVRITA